MAAVNPAVTGGPVGGANMMMGGDPGLNMPATTGSEEIKIRLNTWIYEYVLKLGMHEAARALNSQQDKFKIDSKPKSSPGRRKDGEANGVDSDAMEIDKLDIPSDLPLPNLDMSAQGEGFLVEWFSIFSDIFTAASRPKQGSMTAASHYLMHVNNMQRMKEGQQQPVMMRPGMANQYAMRANMQRNGMVNGAAMANAEMAKRLTPQQMHMAQQAQQKQMQAQQQQQMQRDGGDVDMNGRPGTPGEADNGGSPSKRPRLDGQQFQGNMMANGRPMQAGVPQGMMIQNSFNPQQMNPQYRPNGGMPQQKPMPPGMPNGAMMNMNNAGSPGMMVGMANGQFGTDAAMEMYNTGRMGGQMQGGPATAQSGNHALQDYQMQLMLLEQQNKKRLMMARQEQDNQVNRDGAPMAMGGTGMSPSGSRSGTSPNPADQMKRTPQLGGGLPGSPSAGENMQGRSPAGMQFMNGGMPGGDFGNPMFMGDKQGMAGPGGPNMRPPTSMQNMQGRMGGQFPGGQPMVQNPSQGGQPMGTPGQRNEMPPPQAPAGGPQRTASSPAQSGNAPPTPSQTNKANPKNKKGKDDAGTGAANNKKKPAKKNSQANASNDSQTTPAPAASVPPAPAQQMPAAPPAMQQPDLSQNTFPSFDNTENFNLDFSTLDNTDVLENFDFDSFLNTSTDDAFNFDGGMGVGNDFSLDTGGD